MEICEILLLSGSLAVTWALSGQRPFWGRTYLADLQPLARASGFYDSSSFFPVRSGAARTDLRGGCGATRIPTATCRALGSTDRESRAGKPVPLQDPEVFVLEWGQHRLGLDSELSTDACAILPFTHLSA